MNSHIVNYNEVFLILAFILLMIGATAKLSPSNATSLTQVNPGFPQDKIKQIVDTNAFSDLSRNMTSSTGDSGQSFASNATDSTGSVSSKSSASAASGNTNSTNKLDGGSSSTSGSSLAP
jgi:hypothetical protein